MIIHAMRTVVQLTKEVHSFVVNSMKQTPHSLPQKSVQLAIYLAKIGTPQASEKHQE